METTLARPPHPALASFVDYGFICINREPWPSNLSLRCKDLPNANARVFFCVNDPRVSGTNRRFELYFQGPRGRIAESSTPWVEVAGFAIKPGGVKAFIDVPALEVADQFLPLELIWGTSAHALLDEMVAARDAASRLVLLEQALIRRRMALPPGDSFVLAAAKMIETQRGRGSLAPFFDRTGYSARQVLRKFNEWMGLSPKEYARVVRFQTLFEKLDFGADLDWALLARRYGYFDPAHLAHDFKKLLGQSPSDFLSDFKRWGVLIPGQVRREIIAYSR